jgi:hypothetical protein
MKVRKLVQKMYAAIISGDEKKEKRLWLKALKKSLKHKNTHVIK